MEALAIFGIASNVMQTINFAYETVSIVKRIYRTGSSALELVETRRHLSEAAGHLSEELRKLPEKSLELENDLFDVAQKCIDAVKELEDEVNSLSVPASKRGLRSAIKTTWKISLRKHRLELLERNICSYQRTMETQILVRLRSKSDTLLTQQKQGFDHLSQQLQRFTRQYLSGDTPVSTLVGEENAAQIRALELRSINERARGRLLSSLKFPGMNSRRNQIAENYPRTYSWVLEIDESGENWSEDEASFESSPDEEVTWHSFVAWLKSDESLYWLSGKPGSGKSTLMKFLASRPETKAALQVWRSKVQVLSHYLWSPGAMMQRSVKGVWCSLLHQLFSYSDDLIDQALSDFPQLRSKDSDTDWDTAELAKVTKATMQACGQGLCIFIDGLDETCEEDGPDGILNIIEDLQREPFTKICAASRPEPAFRRKLDTYPGIHLHKVSRRDIARFTNRILPNDIFQDGKLRYLLIQDLVLKAQGVFLWAALVAKSLRCGIENGDTSEELRVRLDSMPSDLVQLYQNMWLRIPQDDRIIYREKAKLYFSLVLNARNFQSKRLDYIGEYTVFELMLASKQDPQEFEQMLNRTVPVNTWMRECDRVIGDMDTCCAGLLEVQSGETSERIGSTDSEDSVSGLIPYTTMAVQFIHRSVYDFLEYTEGGRMLQWTETFSLPVLVQRRFQASLMSRNIWKTHEVGSFPRFSLALLRSYLESLHRLQTYLPPDCINGLMSACRSMWLKGSFFLYDMPHNTLTYEDRCVRAPAPMDFMVYASHRGLYTAVKDYVDTHEVGTRTATAYLHSACLPRPINVMRVEDMITSYLAKLQLVQNLLNRGADPSMTMLLPLPAELAIGRGYHSYDFCYDKDLTHPFGTLLIEMYYLFNSERPCSDVLGHASHPKVAYHNQLTPHYEEIMEAFQALIKHGTDLNMRIPAVYFRPMNHENGYLEPLQQFLVRDTAHDIPDGTSCTAPDNNTPSALVLDMSMVFLIGWVCRHLQAFSQPRRDVSDIRVVAFFKFNDEKQMHEFYRVESVEDSMTILEEAKVLEAFPDKALEDVNLSHLQRRLPVIENHLEFYRQLGWCTPMENCVNYAEYVE